MSVLMLGLHWSKPNFAVRLACRFAEAWSSPLNLEVGLPPCAIWNPQHTLDGTARGGTAHCLGDPECMPLRLRSRVS